MLKRRNRCVRRKLVLTSLLLVLCQSAMAQAPAEPADSVDSRAFVDEQDITWKVNDFNASRWKTLIGGVEGGQIEEADIQFGLWQLGPRSTYHGHKHAAPEIYYILSGRALWTVDTENREVLAGATILTRPGKVHKMTNLTDEPVEAIWVWWAPGGDRGVFSGEYLFTEPAPEQPVGSGFQDEAGDKLY